MLRACVKASTLTMQIWAKMLSASGMKQKELKVGRFPGSSWQTKKYFGWRWKCHQIFVRDSFVISFYCIFLSSSTRTRLPRRSDVNLLSAGRKKSNLFRHKASTRSSLWAWCCNSRRNYLISRPPSSAERYCCPSPECAAAGHAPDSILRSVTAPRPLAVWQVCQFLDAS